LDSRLVGGASIVAAESTIGTMRIDSIGEDILAKRLMGLPPANYLTDAKMHLYLFTDFLMSLTMDANNGKDSIGT